jgi:hypothetical protein
MQKTSFLIAAIGANHAVLAQCFANTESDACKAIAALFLDDKGAQATEIACIDTGAMPGLWMPADPQYLRGQIANAKQ